MRIENGILQEAVFVPSKHHNSRPSDRQVDLLVIHNISLPPGEFGGPYIEQLFTGKLDPEDHEYFKDIYHLEVSAHFLIRRDGKIIQFVPLHFRAWHAGLSSFQGQGNCNDNSIGIELEGTDNISYTEAQYNALTELSEAIVTAYPGISLGRIVGHQDIAPNRKTDPGVAFDWTHYRKRLVNKLENRRLQHPGSCKEEV